MVRYVAAFALLAVNGPAAAEPWARVSRSTDGVTGFADLQSIRTEGQHRRAWFRFDYERPARDGVASARELLLVDCTAETSAVKSYVHYAADGSSLRSRTYDDYTIQWHPVVPGTTGERQYNFVCTYPIGTDWRDINGLEFGSGT